MPFSPTAPPQFQETPPPVLEVQELEPVTLHCVARGSPQPHVTWKLQGEDLGQGRGQVQVSPWAGRVGQLKCEGKVGAELEGTGGQNWAGRPALRRA